MLVTWGASPRMTPTLCIDHTLVLLSRVRASCDVLSMAACRIEMTLPGRGKLFRVAENGGPTIDASRKEEATRLTCFSHLIASPHRRNTHAATRPRITKKTPWGFHAGRDNNPLMNAILRAISKIANISSMDRKTLLYTAISVASRSHNLFHSNLDASNHHDELHERHKKGWGSRGRMHRSGR